MNTQLRSRNILGTGDISQSKTDKGACPRGAYVLEGLSKRTDLEYGKERKIQDDIKILAQGSNIKMEGCACFCSCTYPNKNSSSAHHVKSTRLGTRQSDKQPNLAKSILEHVGKHQKQSPHKTHRQIITD